MTELEQTEVISYALITSMLSSVIPTQYPDWYGNITTTATYIVLRAYFALI